MPRKAASFSRSDVRAAWKLMEEMGLEPTAVKYHPDGTFRIMTKKHTQITNKVIPDNQPSEWD